MDLIDFIAVELGGPENIGIAFGIALIAHPCTKFQVVPSSSSFEAAVWISTLYYMSNMADSSAVESGVLQNMKIVFGIALIAHPCTKFQLVRCCSSFEAATCMST
jgi:hypothetical protein